MCETTLEVFLARLERRVTWIRTLLCHNHTSMPTYNQYAFLPSLCHTHATSGRSSYIFWHLGTIPTYLLALGAYSTGYGSRSMATRCKLTLWFEGWFCRGV